jgi:kynureninase
MQNTLSFARQQDKNDVLQKYRKQFHIPQHEGKNVLYFCGNSLGLQPKSIKKALLNELDQWSKYGVEGHFMGEMPWMHYHKFLSDQSAALVGALPEEVVVMNTLTTNLHLMMVSFYQPTKTRFKIIMEGGAFPSDQYAMETQVRFHGFSPEDAIIEIHPRAGEKTLRTSDIEKTIMENRDSLALVMFAGVNYYTGQFFDIQAITKAGHEAGAKVGFDLAHTAGNLPLQLHEWNVDFAVWCSYKYLNSGPGGPSGVFVHERHASNSDLPRFAGWWGHDEKERFQMKKGFIPMQGAAGWQTSNAQIFSFAAHKASLDIFHEVGMEKLREKSVALSSFFYEILENINKKYPYFDIITPKNSDERGCQISVLTGEKGRELYDYLAKNGVICDWREPNVIRFAPVPLYNSFEDVFKLGQLLEKAVTYGVFAD